MKTLILDCYSGFIKFEKERNIKDIQLPMVVLTASGGHNDIYLVNSEH